MGWSSGSQLFSRVIKALDEEVPDQAKRKAIYLKLIPAFEDADWDTQDECMGEDPAFDAAYAELYEDWRARTDARR